MLYIFLEILRVSFSAVFASSEFLIFSLYFATLEYIYFSIQYCSKQPLTNLFHKVYKLKTMIAICFTENLTQQQAIILLGSTIKNIKLNIRHSCS